MFVGRPQLLKCQCTEHSPRKAKQRERGFSDLLWETSVSGRLPLQDGIVLLLRLCMFGCCNNKTSMVKHDDHRKPELSSCGYFCLLGRCISL